MTTSPSEPERTYEQKADQMRELIREWTAGHVTEQRDRELAAHILNWKTAGGAPDDNIPFR